MTAVEHAPAAVTSPVEPFDDADVAEFQHDDAEAGTNICKLLIAFFFYSLCMMMFVAWWAYSANLVNMTDAPVTEAHGHAGH